MPRKLTHEEFILKLSKTNSHFKNGEFIVIDKYTNSKTPIKCECKEHGIWSTSRPSDLLRGCGCPKCAGNIKFTTEEFLDKLKEKNTHFKNQEFSVIGEYINNGTPIACECPIHGVWNTTTPNTLLTRNSGCPKCSGVVKKTHEEFLIELYEKNKHFRNGEFRIVGTYVNSETPIECECPIHGPWNTTTPASLLGQKSSCPKCSIINKVNPNKKTTEKFIKELEERNIDFKNKKFKVVGEYVNDRTPISCECKEHGIWLTSRPSDLLRGSGCPECAGLKKFTTEKFLEELKKKNTFFKNGDFKVIGEYINSRTPIECECPIHGPWNTTIARNLLHKNLGCPKCSNSSSSFAENYIRCALQQALPDANIPNKGDRDILNGKEIDIPVCKYGFAIEYGSWHWHEDRWSDDYEKFKKLRDKGIKLFTIYDGYNGNVKFPKDFKPQLFSDNLANEKDYASLKNIVKSFLEPDLFESIDWQSAKEKATKLSTTKNSARRTKKYIGLTNTMNNGKKATVTEYRKYNDVDIQFEDGAIKKNVNMEYFKTGRVAYPKTA